MAVYKVHIKQTREVTVEIDEDNAELAIFQAQESFRTGEITFNPSDVSVVTDFNIVE